MKIGAGPYKIEKIDANEILLSKWRSDIFESGNPPSKIAIVLTQETSPKILVEKHDIDSLDQVILAASEVEFLKTKNWIDTVTDLTKEHFLVLNPTTLSSEVRLAIRSAIDPVLLTKAMGIVDPENWTGC